MLRSVWATLDTENKKEITGDKFFTWLKDNKVVAEKKQVEDMLKQCLYLPKVGAENELPKHSSVGQGFFFKLFQKPLLLIGMENGIVLFEKACALENLQQLDPDGM